MAPQTTDFSRLGSILGSSYLGNYHIGVVSKWTRRGYTSALKGACIRAEVMKFLAFKRKPPGP